MKKTYTVYLQGGTKLRVSEERANSIKQAINEEATVVNVDNNLIKTSSIKSILADEEQPPATSVHINDIEAQWNEDCLRHARMTIKEKVNTELTVRIEPVYRISKMKISDDKQKKLTVALTGFFTANKGWPRCPMKFWFDIIADDIRPQASRYGLWYEYISRNDDAIYEWCKQHGIKITDAFQQTL